MPLLFASAQSPSSRWALQISSRLNLTPFSPSFLLFPFFSPLPPPYFFSFFFLFHSSSTHDALLIFECVRRGVMPKVKRRLREDERRLIRSGQVFVFDEKESGIKRWTDGLLWSPSRILWNFLVSEGVVDGWKRWSERCLSPPTPFFAQTRSTDRWTKRQAGGV